jgi:CSLREA domain-containing protein
MQKSHCRAVSSSVLLVVFLVSPATFAADFVVTKSVDTADGLCNADCSLREAIIAANSSPGMDTIHLPGGTYTLSIAGTYEDLAWTGDLDITDDLSLVGVGATCTVIDANRFGDRVFDAIAGTIDIRKVTIRGGNPTYYQGGGGVFNRTTLTLDEVTVTDNEVIGIGGESIMCGGNNAGGGISSYGVLYLSNSTVTGNTANGRGSASDGGGGGIEGSGGMLIITNSVISGNSGGGVLTSCGNDVITKSVITNNTGTGAFGSGIFFRVNGGTLIVSQSTISGNSNYGVVNGDGSVSISESTVSGNCTEITCSAGGGILQSGVYRYPNIYGSTSVINSTVSGNGHQFLSSGGGVRLVYGSLSLTNSTVTGNTVAVGLPNSAGGVVIPPPANPPQSFVGSVQNNIIAYNTGADCSRDLGITGYHNLSSDSSCGFTGTGDRQNTNPMLGALQDNGGPTLTHALSSGSPAVNTGLASGCPSNDQRLAPRYASCDIGSYEWGATPPPLPPKPPDPCIIFADGFESNNTSQWSANVP